jgi:hypothetical protein
MEKVIRDGKVAILYSPRHGAGWYSWHGIEELVYDPKIVDMVQRGEDYENILKYCCQVYGEKAYFNGADQLKIFWLDQGTEFYIDEYDGAELVVTKSIIKWLLA